MRGNSVTLLDIAREVGVSTTTVSVVLNGTRSATRVSDGTRARIVETAERMQYRANAVARGLFRRRMNSIGVVSQFWYPNPVNPIVHELLNGMFESGALYKQGITVYPIQDWAHDEQSIMELCDGRADGLILMDAHLGVEFADRLYRTIPYVTIHSTGATSEAVNVEVDNEAGAYTIVRYLIDQGHRRIAHFVGSLDRSGTLERLAGYRRALEESGLDYDERLVIYAENRSGWGSGFGFTDSSGGDRMGAMIADPTYRPLPTAIFCANDAIAAGTMNILADHNIAVPDQISICGFDDSPNSYLVRPKLTTIRQPLAEMGRNAVQMILDQVDNNLGTPGATKPAPELAHRAALVTPVNTRWERGARQDLLFEGNLILRESVGLPTKQPVNI